MSACQMEEAMGSSRRYVQSDTAPHCLPDFNYKNVLIVAKRPIFKMETMGSHDERRAQVMES